MICLCPVCTTVFVYICCISKRNLPKKFAQPRLIICYFHPANYKPWNRGYQLKLNVLLKLETIPNRQPLSGKKPPGFLRIEYIEMMQRKLQQGLLLDSASQLSFRDLPLETSLFLSSVFAHFEIKINLT